MGLLKAGPDVVAFDGELSDQACGDLESALDLLRKSDVEVPTVDLSDVSRVSSRAIGLLVTLWIDLLDQGRRFDLLASDRVWDVLGIVGVDGVFFKRPDYTPQIREVH